jgi:hypothetical protein
MSPRPPIFCSRFTFASPPARRERTPAPQPSSSRATTPRGRQTPCSENLPLCRSLTRKAASARSTCPSPLPLHARSARRMLMAGHSSPGITQLVIQLRTRRSATPASFSPLGTRHYRVNPYARSLTRPHSKPEPVSPYRRSLTNSTGRKSLRAVTYEKDRVEERRAVERSDLTGNEFRPLSSLSTAFTGTRPSKSFVCHFYVLGGPQVLCLPLLRKTGGGGAASVNHLSDSQPPSFLRQSPPPPTAYAVLTSLPDQSINAALDSSLSRRTT